MLKIKLYCMSLFIIIGILAKEIGAIPLQERGVLTTNLTQVKDDLTTNFAKQIMRIAKAADINSTLDTSANPCENFYQFACGNWYRNNPAQLLKNIITDRFQTIANAFDRRLEKVLHESDNAINDSVEIKIRNFYVSCKVVKDDDILYKQDLQRVYQEFGEFPILLGEGWEKYEEEFVWWETIAKVQHKYGKQIILAVYVMADVKNNTQNSVYIGPPDYSIITNTKLLRVLQEAAIIKDLQHYFGVENKLAKSMAKEMIEFERTLVRGGTDARLGLALQDLLSWKKIEDVKTTYEVHIGMHKFLQLVFGPGVQIPEHIYIHDEKYLENLLKTITETPRRVVANYIMWQLLQDYLVDAAPKDLQKLCIDKTKKYFGKYVDYMVYLRYKNKNVENQMLQVWQDIRKTFRDELQGDKLDWISNSTRKYAIEKLDAMHLYINSYENENFSEIYKDLQLDRVNYVQNIQHILMLETQRNLAKLHKPATTLEAPDVLSFTPAYNILENNIKIPVGLLQPNYFWNPIYPNALKYATFGYLIAHEMIHGFDDEGRNYDKHGNTHAWWDLKSTYGFEERRKCFQAQYHNYKYGGRRLPDSVSQAENIADNAAVKIAYTSYLYWLRNERLNDTEIDKKEVLPGLNFDNLQLFFISFAQIWCDDVQTLFKFSIVSGDSHAPSMYRVIGALSNFQEFSWVYKCPQDANMDPEFKCAIY